MIAFCTFPLAFQCSNLHFGSLFHCFIKLSFAIGYSFAKDCCPCLLLFICKGLLSIFVLSYSFRFCYMFTKAAVLVYLFIYKGLMSLFPDLLTKGCSPCLLLFICKGSRPCVVVFILKGLLSLSLLFICKGPLSLSGAIYLQRTAVLVLGYLFAKDRGPCLMLFICKGLLSTCPNTIRWTAVLAKHGETAYLSGLVKTAVSQIST